MKILGFASSVYLSQTMFCYCKHRNYSINGMTAGMMYVLCVSCLRSLLNNIHIYSNYCYCCDANGLRGGGVSPFCMWDEIWSGIFNEQTGISFQGNSERFLETHQSWSFQRKSTIKFPKKNQKNSNLKICTIGLMVIDMILWRRYMTLDEDMQFDGLRRRLSIWKWVATIADWRGLGLQADSSQSMNASWIFHGWRDSHRRKIELQHKNCGEIGLSMGFKCRKMNEF